MIIFRWALGLFSTTFLFCAGIMSAWAVEPDAPERLIDREYVTLIAVRDGLTGELAQKLSISKKQKKGLARYYKAEGARLIWVNENGLDMKAIAKLISVFKRADQFGLDPRDYSLTKLGGIPESARLTPEELANTELRTSLVAISYADHAQAGDRGRKCGAGFAGLGAVSADSRRRTLRVRVLGRNASRHSRRGDSG